MASLKQQITKLQISLYEKAYKDALRTAGPSREIIEYSKKYEKTLPNKYKTITNNEFLSALQQKRLILYGDFHALRQSQRGFLRLLRDFVFKLQKQSVIVALEMFRSCDQDAIDRYMTGDISEAGFLKKINYAHEWGFFWPNFKVILEFAKEFQLPVIGINSEQGGRDSLKARDRHTADVLVETLRKYQAEARSTIFAMLGEYHLADAHLPAALKGQGMDPAIMARVLTNIDKYYFNLRENSLNAASSEYLKLKKDIYCVINTPPWIKWQSYAIWEEMRASDDADPDDTEGDESYTSGYGSYTEYTFDLDYHFLGIVKNLTTFLGISFSATEMTSFRIFASAEADFFKILKSENMFSNREISQIVERATVDGSYFVSRCLTILLSDLTLNNMATAAGQYLHHVLTKDLDEAADPVETFYRRAIKSAIGMVASKILNPRRKCTELSQFFNIVAHHKGKTSKGSGAKKLRIAKAVLKHHEWILEKLASNHETPEKLPSIVSKVERLSAGEVSLAVGQVIGYQLYAAVMGGRASPSNVHDLFQESLKSSEEVWGRIKDLYRFVPKKTAVI